MKQTKVAVIGHGYVGKAIHEFFESSMEVVVYDPAQGFTDQDSANECDFAVVCVPTPMQEDGAVDLSYIRETIGWLRTPTIVIKSTIPPGTTKLLSDRYNLKDQICFSPEYIGEGKYDVPYWENIPHATDMKKHSFHIFGGEKRVTERAIEYWMAAAGPFPRYLQTDSTTAELVKYSENAWIATKVTFVNELFDIAETFDVDYTELRELWLMDGRVGRSHTLVYPKKRGFSGKCIPKDTNGIVAAAKEKGYEPKLLERVLEVNDQFLKKNPTAI